MPELAGLLLDMRDGVLICGGKELPLGRQKAELLAFLIEAAPHCVSHRDIRKRFYPDRRAPPEWATTGMRVRIYALRQHLAELGAPYRIDTRRSFGWRLVPIEGRAPE